MKLPQPQHEAFVDSAQYALDTMLGQVRDGDLELVFFLDRNNNYLGHLPYKTGEMTQQDIDKRISDIEWSSGGPVMVHTVSHNLESIAWWSSFFDHRNDR